jgi:tellurite resistance protein TehA-like permease
MENVWYGGGVVSRNNWKNLLPIGLVSLAAGLILRNFLHSDYSEFAAGLLIGMSIVFMIAGLFGREKGITG